MSIYKEASHKAVAFGQDIPLKKICHISGGCGVGTSVGGMGEGVKVSVGGNGVNVVVSVGGVRVAVGNEVEVGAMVVVGAKVGVVF